MNIEDMALGLIKALKADETEANFEGVVGVLKTMIAATNADWEEYITQDTNELLAEDNICCEGCGAPISVKRYRKVLYVLNS